MSRALDELRRAAELAAYYAAVLEATEPLHRKSKELNLLREEDALLPFEEALALLQRAAEDVLHEHGKVIPCDDEGQFIIDWPEEINGHDTGALRRAIERANAKQDYRLYLAIAREARKLMGEGHE